MNSEVIDNTRRKLTHQRNGKKREIGNITLLPCTEREVVVRVKRKVNSRNEGGGES